MELVRLPVGERAPADSDCISITEAGSCLFRLSGSLLSGGTSIAIGGGEPFESFGLAEAAGASWAEGEGVRTLYVSTLKLPQPEDAIG